MNVLVVGSAGCVWDDLRSLGGTEINAIITVNKMTRDYPLRPTYGASVHAENVDAQYSRPDVPFVSTKFTDTVQIVYDQQPYRRGTSALYAVGFALLLGAKRVVLAGAPIDDTPHYYPGPGIGPDLAPYRDPWRECLPQIRGRVFSLSGWTRELLGSPL